MDTGPTLRHDWDADLRRPSPSVPSACVYEGAPKGRDFREREAARLTAAIAALAVSLHLPTRTGWRHPTRLVAALPLFVGAAGLLSHHRWPERVTLGGCALAEATMLARPKRYDSLASAAATIAALALVDLCRMPRRFASGPSTEVILLSPRAR